MRDQHRPTSTSTVDPDASGLGEVGVDVDHPEIGEEIRCHAGVFTPYTAAVWTDYTRSPSGSARRQVELGAVVGRHEVEPRVGSVGDHLAHERALGCDQQSPAARADPRADSIICRAGPRPLNAASVSVWVKWMVDPTI